MERGGSGLAQVYATWGIPQPWVVEGATTVVGVAVVERESLQRAESGERN